MPGVDGVDAPHAGGEEGTREATRSGAEIESDATADTNVETRERGAQLGLAAQWFRIPHDDGRVRADQRAGVGDDASVDQHAAGQDCCRWMLHLAMGQQLSQWGVPSPCHDLLRPAIARTQDGRRPTGAGHASTGNLGAASVALFGLILAVNLVGDGVRDVLDPRTRRERP